MTTFLNEFGIFLTSFLSFLLTALNWYLSTIPGKITIYLAIIGLIFGLIFFIIEKI